MKKIRLITACLGLILALCACGVDIPTKSDGENGTEKAPRTAAATDNVPSSAEKPDDPFFPGGSSVSIPGLKNEYDPADLNQNNNSYAAAGGRIVHAYGGTWFVQPGQENDGHENGYVYSENIYFLSDEDGAEPVLVGWIPSDATDGIQQWTVFSLVPGPETPEGRFLYFTSRNSLYRLNLATGETVRFEYRVFPGWSFNIFNRSGDKLYFAVAESTDPTSEGYYNAVSMVLDLTSGSIEPFEPHLPAAQGEYTKLIGMNGDYLYYAKIAARHEEYEPYGFYRIKAGSAQEEEVAPVTCEEINAVFCAGNYLIYGDDDADEFVFLDVESGREVLRVSEDELDLLDYSYALSGDSLWYFRDDQLTCMEIPSGKKEAVITGKDRDIVLLVDAGDWIWFADEDDDGVYRVRKNGRILPASPVVPLPDWDADYYDDPKAEGVWLYREYPNCVKLCGYTGSESALTLPSQLGGKPVTIVQLNLKEMEGIRSLVIPEGIISLQSIYAPYLKELSLPKSLEQMVIRSYDYTLHLPEDAAVRYAGTVDEWQALYDLNRNLHDVAVDSQRNEADSVICSDGTWSRSEAGK